MTSSVGNAAPKPRILMVCTGNICRSPLASLLLARHLAGNRVEIDSAGVGALVGMPMPDEAQFIARSWGVGSPEHHLARQFEPDDAVGAALILTATRALRRAVVESAPSAVRRTFTLREFARIVDRWQLHEATSQEPTEFTLPEFVHAAAARRGTVLAGADADDITDPYRKAGDVYDASAGQISDACTTIAPVLLAVLDRSERTRETP